MKRTLLSVAACSFLLAFAVSCDKDDDPEPDVPSQETKDEDQKGEQEKKITREEALEAVKSNTRDMVVTGEAFDITSTSVSIPFKLNVPQRDLETAKFGIVWTDNPTLKLASGGGCGELTFNYVNIDVENQVLLAENVQMSPSSTYRYTAYYTRGDGFVYGEEKTFSTYPPEVFTANAVDLGLSVSWATCNLGAVNPYQTGVFYAYGDTSGLMRPEDASQLPAQDISGTVFDPATYKLGAGWSSPNDEQILELLNKCEWRLDTQNGYAGYSVKGPNGREIFIPATGYYVAGNKTALLSNYVYLWSGSLVAAKPAMASVIYASKDGSVISLSQYSRFWRMPIRPVKAK